MQALASYTGRLVSRWRWHGTVNRQSVTDSARRQSYFALSIPASICETHQGSRMLAGKQPLPIEVIQGHQHDLKAWGTQR